MLTVGYKPFFYFIHSFIKYVRVFIFNNFWSNSVSGANVIKIFTAVIDKFS